MGKYYSFWHSEPKLVLVFNCCNSADVNDVRLKHSINLLNQIHRAWKASWRILFKQQEGKNVCWKVCKGFLLWHLRIRKEPRNPICTFLVVLCILSPGTTEGTTENQIFPGSWHILCQEKSMNALKAELWHVSFHIFTKLPLKLMMTVFELRNE